MLASSSVSRIGGDEDDDDDERKVFLLLLGRCWYPVEGARFGVNVKHVEAGKSESNRKAVRAMVLAAMITIMIDN